MWPWMYLLEAAWLASSSRDCVVEELRVESLEPVLDLRLGKEKEGRRYVGNMDVGETLFNIDMLSVLRSKGDCSSRLDSQV